MLTKKTDDTLFSAVGIQAAERVQENPVFGADEAANAAYFDRSQMQARRLRRQSRMSRVGGSLNFGGWSVRSW
jgi:hypothetical protein